VINAVRVGRGQYDRRVVPRILCVARGSGFFVATLTFGILLVPPPRPRPDFSLPKKKLCWQS
jgi:hypothetical protein